MTLTDYYDNNENVQPMLFEVKLKVIENHSNPKFPLGSQYYYENYWVFRTLQDAEQFIVDNPQLLEFDDATKNSWRMKYLHSKVFDIVESPRMKRSDSYWHLKKIRFNNIGVDRGYLSDDMITGVWDLLGQWSAPTVLSINEQLEAMEIHNREMDIIYMRYELDRMNFNKENLNHNKLHALLWYVKGNEELGDWTVACEFGKRGVK